LLYRLFIFILFVYLNLFKLLII